MMATVFGYKREAVRVKVMKSEVMLAPEYRRFSVDPQITSYEVLLSLLAKAFDIRGDFTVSYRAIDDYGQEAYISLLSDWDLDAAFLSASEPYLCLRVDMRPFEETCEIEEEPVALVETKPTHGLHGIIMNHVERTFNMVQRALNLTDETGSVAGGGGGGGEVIETAPRPPLTDSEFRQFLDPVGQLVHVSQLRTVVYYGGIEPSLRKVVWKHILNVYPEGMSGKERMDYMKRKSQEYITLRDTWREMLKNGQMVGDLAYVTSMVRKDVLRTDRHHVFYGGSDDNKNIASLFNILTTYALNHPAVSYCQGMSDLASPLLVTMNDEAHAYVCFCALMQRLSPNFLLDGITMTQRFQHLADGLQHYDSQFYSYLKSHQADDLLFCYRWLLLEMKREFAFEDALRMLEVMWSSLPPAPPQKELLLFEQEFVHSPPIPSPRPKINPYTKICALRRGINNHTASLDETQKRKENCKPFVKSRPYMSLDDGELLHRKSMASGGGNGTGLIEGTGVGANRVVRNLNEFLSLEGGGKSPTGKCGKRDESISTPPPLLEMKSEEEEVEKEENTNRRDQSPDDPTEFYPMTTSMTRELRLELESLERQVFGEEGDGGGGMNDEVFVWENPLGKGEGDEGVTPSELEANGTKPLTGGMGSSLLDRRRVTLEELSQSAASLPPPSSKLHQSHPPGFLPPPSEFGGGNPFLMFLCITVLCQHRDYIIRNAMDYNEMAIHFDKMVRKHDVTTVLNKARRLYAAYLKQYSPNTSVIDYSEEKRHIV